MAKQNHGTDSITQELEVMFAQQYSKQMSERIKAGIQKRKENKANVWIERDLYRGMMILIRE